MNERDQLLKQSVKSGLNFNLRNFKQVRPFLNIKAHIEYCFINWSLTIISTLKNVESLFKKAIKNFDKKPLSFHHCDILARHDFLSYMFYFSS